MYTMHGRDQSFLKHYFDFVYIFDIINYIRYMYSNIFLYLMPLKYFP